MKLTIRQKTFSYKPGYAFQLNGRNYEAAESTWSLFGKTIIRDESGQEVATLARTFSLSRKTFRVFLADGTCGVFQMQPGVNPVYELIWHDNTYRVVGHNDLTYSIFGELCQVGAMVKNSLSMGKGDEYTVRINDDENPILHACLCIMVDLISHNGFSQNLGINCDLGNMGPEFSTFDEAWEPKTTYGKKNVSL